MTPAEALATLGAWLSEDPDRCVRLRGAGRVLVALEHGDREETPAELRALGEAELCLREALSAVVRSS